MKLRLSLRAPFFSIFLLTGLFGHLGTARAIDYRDVPGVIRGTFEENRVARLAASIGRGAGVLTAEDVKTISAALKKNKPVPALLNKEWQKLLRMAQSVAFLQSAERFYPVGYEFESTHKNKISWEEWDRGSKAFQEMIAGTFGLQKSAVFEPEADDLYPTARIYDEEGRRWSLTTEHVDMDILKSGYELGTPPIYRPAELEQIASFRARLGRHKMGQSNMMTGAHQTYFPFPTDLKEIDPKLAGRVAANLQILHSNYGTAIHDLMGIKRMGGATDNFFFRPVIFDHYELLKELSDANPATLDIAAVKTLLFDKYIEKEFEVQVAALVRMEVYDADDAAKVRKWSKADKAKFKTAWKYRDTQLKINLDPKSKAPVLLWESRILDYIADEPEKAMLKTLVDQLLIDQAYRLAAEGKIAKLTVTPRHVGESEADYWARLQVESKMSPEAFLEQVGLKDVEMRRLILGKTFIAKDPGMKMVDRLSFAFEMEGWDDSIVKVILPRDAKLRAQWRKLSASERIAAMKRMGFKFEGEFNADQFRVLSTEFYFDHQRYPFGHPELHVEASGNWEVKSSGRGMYTQAELEGAVKALSKNFSAFGLHLHGFLPDSMVKGITQNADEYGKFLELHSFLMSLQAYAEANPTDAGHWLDSWSLDRYSPGEIQSVKNHLKGTAKIDSIAQKYHNIATRPFPGGLDIEIRDIDDDVAYGLNQLKSQLEFIAKPEMPESIKKSPPLFSEFREHANIDRELKVYTLEAAVAEKYPLTPEQRKLLHQFQFEIYKPSMENYMYFKDFSAIDETPPELLDLAYVRTNFENNIALPLLNYGEQSFLSADELAVLQRERSAFIDRIYKRLIAVQANPEYAFLRESENFHQLCEYLERSKHPSKPKPSRLSEAVKETRRELLEDLTYDLRGEVVRFVKGSKLNEVFGKTVRTLSCPSQLKMAESNPAVTRILRSAKVSRPKLR